jgi:hypothetical protein
VACSLGLRIGFLYRYKNSGKPRRYFEIDSGFKQADFEIRGGFGKTGSAAYANAHQASPSTYEVARPPIRLGRGRGGFKLDTTIG